MAQNNFNSIEKRLLFYAEKQYNVLLEGRHGVGKTSLIREVFNKMGWRSHILNASTIDPYMDFIGVPTRQIDESSAVQYLEMILPKKFAFDEVDALFLDEINRGKKETLNGLLDIIQNKSIKNKYLKNLKVVWAAQNPYFEDLDEDEQIYNVQPLDPALKDRFHVFIDMPYTLNKKWLSKEYGGLATPFIQWWDNLPDGLELKCSPRRIEYAIQIVKDGGAEYLGDILNKELPIAQLKKSLIEYLSKHGKEELKNQILKSDIKEASKLIGLENLPTVIELIKSKEIDSKYLASINSDALSIYISNHKDIDLFNIIDDFIHQNPNNTTITKELIDIMEDYRNSLSVNINKTWSKISPDIILNNDTHKDISNAILESVFNIYQDKGNIESLSMLYQSLDLSSNFKPIKNKIIEHIDKTKDAVKSFLSLKKNAKSALDFKELNTLEEVVLLQFKSIFNNQKSQSNIMGNQLFMAIYIEIFKDELKQAKKTQSEIEQYIKALFFSSKGLISWVKQYHNIAFLLAHNDSAVESLVLDILNNTLSVSESFLDFNNRLNFNTKDFSSFISKLQRI